MQNSTKLNFYKSLKALLNEGACSERTAYKIMKLTYEIFHHLDRQIASVWDVEDVYSIRPNFSHEQAMKVLQNAVARHDATIGINWDVLENQADLLYSQLAK